MSASAGPAGEAMTIELSTSRQGRPVEADHHRSAYAALLGRSAAMQAVRRVVEQVADTIAPVLILGESGVGKELVARALHLLSHRAPRPFVKVNCAALPPELLESELFGHERGAFTGAERAKPGHFELGAGGTLFLDEIAEIPPPLQAKLLHVLQDGEFWRVGGVEPLRAEARVVAATNRDLDADLASGRFRDDLYYRLAVVEIRVPPLRERREEIPLLVGDFLQRFEAEYRRPAALSPDLLTRLTVYDWPGNVRELENAVRRLVVLGPAGLGRELLVGPESPEPRQAVAVEPPSRPATLLEISRKAARSAQRAALIDVLERVHWNRAEAARILKVSYKTLLAKIIECGVLATERMDQP